MSFRTVTAALLLMTSVAAADDLTLEPVCAELSDTDALSPNEQTVAREAFVRLLEGANLLVVEDDCTDRYRLSHTTENGNFIVRIVGPRVIRFARNPDRQDLVTVYRSLLDLVIAAEQEIDAAAVTKRDADATEPEPDHEQEGEETSDVDVGSSEAPSVRTDTTLFAQFLAGTSGVGLGVGLRVPVSTSRALDLYTLRTEGDYDALTLVGARLLTFTNPHGARSAYLGAGIAYSGEEKMEYDGLYSDAGAQLESSIGVMFNRTEKFRVFLQADLDIPLYGTWVPTFMVSLGAGG